MTHFKNVLKERKDNEMNRTIEKEKRQKRKHIRDGSKSRDQKHRRERD